MSKLKPHPLAELLPMMSDAEYAALKLDIQANKQRDPIVLLDGKILDGRNRYRACVELDIDPKTVDYKPSWGEPIQYVRSKAQHRHMSESQRACVAVNFGEKFDRQNSDDAQKVTAEDLADIFGCNRDYVFKARKLRAEAPDLFDEVFRDAKPVYVADRELKRQIKSRELKKKERAALRASAAVGDEATIIVGDCVEELPKLLEQGKRPRLIFADSPYNIGIDYGNGAKADKLSEHDFLDWCDQWINACCHLLADDGSLFVMIDAPHLTDFEVMIRGDTGNGPMHRRNVIVWPETFSQYTAGNFTESWRAILYYTKDPKKFVWHGDQVLVPSDRQAKYGDKRADPAGRVPSNVWSDIPRMVDNDPERMPGFPTQLPERLLERIILATTEPGDLVVDPFNGSGTTGRAALRNHRRYIGIEKSPKYAADALASLRVLNHRLKEGL